ncbi:hypothetical protein CTAYLR_010133 [Chrysophaeum taylorii]|uniref:Potassium channel domain-containing protein n=1 Tax=Chrysophaeum taylorii TaxID=2483200 RepID=A0AAD7UP61_9STRA|nr:hypothetical protein CTAYLR_010133 [Chrysophaeum taylorii]
MKLPATMRPVVARVLRTPTYEVGSAVATLMSCGTFAVGTLDTVPREIFDGAEELLSVLFAADFAVRCFASPSLGALELIDLASFLPLFLESNLSFLRLVRVLRLQRLLSDVQTFGRFRAALGLPPSETTETSLELARVLLSLFTLLFVASGLIYTAEHEVNDSINDFFTALYFGLTTLTTVGFGDIVPVTPNGRLVVSFSILVGIAVIPLQLTTLAESLLAPPIEDARTPRPSIQARAGRPPPCRVCGAPDHNKDANFCFSCGAPLLKPVS